MSIVERVTALAEPICRDLGVEIYDVDHRGGVVRVVVERAGGVDIDVIALITRELSRSLDHDDPLPGRYTLEVSSPGLERTLRVQWHFERAVGAAVKVKTKPYVEGERRFDGVLLQADATGFVVDVNGQARRLDYDDVERAQTVFVWEVTPKPGKANKQAHSKHMKVVQA